MWGRPNEQANFEKPKSEKKTGWGGAPWGHNALKNASKPADKPSDAESKAAFRGDKFFLSNMYKAPVTYHGVTYLCSEVAFQAQKCADDAERESLIALNDPFKVKKAAFKVKKRDDWDDVKVGIMREIVYAKFSQNPDLAEKLLATGDEHLAEENKWNDRFWGTVNGEGENHLGKILMEVRTAIREATAEFGALPSTATPPKAAPVGKDEEILNLDDFEVLLTDAEDPFPDSASATPAPIAEAPKEVPKTSAKPAPKKENAPKAWGKNPESQEIVNAIAKGGSISEETFKKMKGICLKIVEGKEFYSFSKFKPAEYKYFTELVELYQKYVGKAISKEDAEEKERKLHREYEEDKANEQKYFEFIKQWNNAIRVTEMNRASINKCEDKDIALDLALQCIAMMTGDTPFLGFARDKFLKDKPHAVSYDVSADFIEPQPTEKKDGEEE